MSERSFHPRTPQPSDKPRRVRAGVKLPRNTALPMDLSWAGAQWMETCQRLGGRDGLQAGFDYAMKGQTRRFEPETGVIAGAVQGRQYKAYKTKLEFDVINAEDWNRLIHLMGEQAIYSAKLLAGEMPSGIEDAFGELDLRLFPTEIRTSCTCDEPKDSQWCKHMWCVAMLAARAIDDDPMMIFELRGIDREELMERLRQKRTSSTSALGVAYAHSAPMQPTLAHPLPSLEQAVEDYWDAGPELDQVETPLDPPDVSHPLLRRLGPSPFEEGKFPLVGLLATCYDTISRAARERVEDQPEALDTDTSRPERQLAE